MYDDVCAVKPLSVKTVFFVAQTKFVVIPCTLQAAHLIHPVRQLGIQVYFKIRKNFLRKSSMLMCLLLWGTNITNVLNVQKNNRNYRFFFFLFVKSNLKDQIQDVNFAQRSLDKRIFI